LRTEPSTFHRTTFPEPCHAGRLRQAFATWLQGHGIGGTDIEDWSLVLSELLANAFRASPDNAPVEIRATYDNGVNLSVRNQSAGRVPHLEPRAAPFATSGRGLLIVERLTEELELRVSGDEVEVSCATHAAGSDSTPTGGSTGDAKLR
jgi:anti-sigma regulatory factor (Ser/Thr protein kinase)